VRISGRTTSAASFRRAIRADRSREERGPYVPFTTRERQAAFEGINRAIGGGGVRLRIRLLARRTERAHAVGSPIRRRRHVQGVFDQFSSGRAQVARMSGWCAVAARTKGRAPEHSSARPSASADVRRGQYARCNCTTPAITKHPRRQLKRDIRKPLSLDDRRVECALAAQCRGSPRWAGHDVHAGLRTMPDAPGREDSRSVRTNKSRRVVMCSRHGILRTSMRSGEARSFNAVSAARSSRSIVSREGAGQRARRFTRAERNSVVPRGSAQHGRIFLHGRRNLEWVLEQIGAKKQAGPIYAGRGGLGGNGDR